MEKLCDLIKDLRRRSRGFKEASDNCRESSDKLALHARADEAEQCAIAIEMALCDADHPLCRHHGEK